MYRIALSIFSIFLSFSFWLANLGLSAPIQAAPVQVQEPVSFILGTPQNQTGDPVIWFAVRKSTQSTRFELVVDGHSSAAYIKEIEGGFVKTGAFVVVTLPLVEGNSSAGSSVQVKVWPTPPDSATYFSKVEVSLNGSASPLVWSLTPSGESPNTLLRINTTTDLSSCLNACSYSNNSQYVSCFKYCLQSYGTFVAQ